MVMEVLSVIVKKNGKNLCVRDCLFPEVIGAICIIQAPWFTSVTDARSHGAGERDLCIPYRLMLGKAPSGLGRAVADSIISCMQQQEKCTTVSVGTCTCI